MSSSAESAVLPETQQSEIKRYSHLRRAITGRKNGRYKTMRGLTGKLVCLVWAAMWHLAAYVKSQNAQALLDEPGIWDNAESHNSRLNRRYVRKSPE